MGYLLLSLGFESGDTPYLFKLNPLFQHKLITDSPPKGHGKDSGYKALRGFKNDH